MTAPPPPAPLSGRTALVLGLGRFSGGVETVRFLAAQGATVIVSDTAAPETLEASTAAVAGTGAELVFGPQAPSLLDRLRAGDLVVASPAIPFDHPVTVEALRRGLEVTSEIRLFLERVPATVLGVTGTKGKSTTATLLSNMVRASGVRAHLGGNVGRSLLNELPRIAHGDAVVLELSSFQLHALRGLGFAPRVAVVTNLFPDHLDRHGTFEHYGLAKRVLLESQAEDDVAVLPAHDEALERLGFPTAGRARRVRFGTEVEGPGVVVTAEGNLVESMGRRGTDLDAFRLWGAHNRGNAAAAAAAALAFGCTWSEVRAGAAATKPLDHRLEPVVEIGGVLYVDDSIATTPQSAIAALEAVPRPCVILVGGKDKGSDASSLVKAIAAGARGVVGIGTTGAALVEAVRAAGGPPAEIAEGGPDLVGAVRAAAAMARPGDAVLLSPGYSSLDQHASFAVRGDRFQAAARALASA